MPRRPVAAPAAPPDLPQASVLQQREVDVNFSLLDEGTAGVRMSAKLAEQGFCTVDANVTAETLRQAHNSIHKYDRLGAFMPPPLAVSRGLLGRGSAAMAEVVGLDDADELKPGAENGLADLARFMDYVGECLGSYTDMTSFSYTHRTSFTLHRAGETEASGVGAPPITAIAARQWEPIFAHQRLSFMVFLGPGDATLELRPHASRMAKPYLVPLQPGSMVIIRPDILESKLMGQDRALTMVSMYITTATARPKVVAPAALELGEWILDFLQDVKEKQNEEDFDLWGSDCLPRDWQLLMNHNFYQGNYIPVMGQSIKVPSTYDPHAWASATNAGLDCVTEVPIQRWDHTMYMDPELDSWKYGKSYSSHAGFADGLELFDSTFFSMSPGEAAWAAPHQRLVLDCGYQALHAAGYRRKSLMNSRIAHITAFGSLQWNFVDKPDSGSGGSYGACGEAASIVAARLSYIFGMKGNCYTVDTEGASGLTALHSCCAAVQTRGRGTADAAALATATFVNLTPMMWPRMCAAGLLSKKGRCLTFSTMADGYVQTDGVAAAVIKPLPPVDDDQPDDSDLGLGLITSMAMNHNGMGSSLTAPKGPVEQELILEACQNAMISALDVDAVECHGAGAYLADAVEITSLVRAHRGDGASNEPLGVMALKTNCGNMVWSAGLTAFLKVLLNAQRGTINPLCHLHIVNPHIDETMEDSPTLVPTEVARFRSQMGSFTGTMSRGFGGTNAYVISRGGPPQEDEEASVHESLLSYWPGGGGSLDIGSVPFGSYCIAGSFNNWLPEAMESVTSTKFRYTVTLPDDGTAEFQIWLDGDSNRILNPGWPQALSSAPVTGPHEFDNAKGLNWLICGEHMQLGVPGDQYQVLLQISGKWQSISWTKA